MTFEDLNWDILDRLRATFLQGKPARKAYWRSIEDLAHYDVTFGERIGWKWDAVLGELGRLSWSPPEGVNHLIDWGCGSGIAGRRMLQAFPALQTLSVFDHSPQAVAFAAARARAERPGIDVRESMHPPLLKDSMVVLSHVANELTPAATDALLEALPTATVILWVEPGTHEAGRCLQAVRARLLDRFDAVAPCTHQGPCPLLAINQERHWCHHFARPPGRVFTDGNWIRFARRAGVDLRSLPYSYIVLVARGAQAGSTMPPPRSRVLGRAQLDKSSAMLRTCGRGGYGEVRFHKRLHPDVFAALKRDPGALSTILDPKNGSWPGASVR